MVDLHIHEEHESLATRLLLHVNPRCGVDDYKYDSHGIKTNIHKTFNIELGDAKTDEIGNFKYTNYTFSHGFAKIPYQDGVIVVTTDDTPAKDHPANGARIYIYKNHKQNNKWGEMPNNLEPNTVYKIKRHLNTDAPQEGNAIRFVSKNTKKYKALGKLTFEKVEITANQQKFKTRKMCFIANKNRSQNENNEIGDTDRSNET